MRLLIATETYYPNISGVAVFSHNMAKKMVERGMEVFVIAPSPKFEEYTEEVDGIKIFRVASKINKFRKGYYVSKFPFKKVARFIEDARPDVIHLQDPAWISLSVLFKASKMQIPLVATNHFSLEYIISYLPYLKFIEPIFMKIASGYLDWFYSKCDIVTCPTQTVAKNFQKGKIKDRIRVISNGVDISRFLPHYGDINLVKKRWNIPLDKPLVLYVGRQDVDKNLITYIKAVPFVLKKLDACFVLVGNGTEQEKLKKAAKDLGVDKKVIFIDFVPHYAPILPKIYQAASLFVNPCPYETLSLVVLEAEASGLPIVAANAGALPEVVRHGVNGLLFKPFDVYDLAQKIITLLKNPDLMERMGQKSVELSETHLVEHTYSRFEDIYLSLSNK